MNTKKYIIGHSTDYTLLKGTEDFLKIVKELKYYTENFEVHITESIQNKLERERYLRIIREAGLQKKVIFLGTLSEKNLAKFYAELDIFCYTGSYLCPGGSTASLSVLEAQSCGTPVLRSIGTDDEIIDKKTGYCIKPEKSKKAAKILSTFLELNEDKKEEMRKASRKHILEHFSWDKSAEKLQSIIKLLK